MNTSNTPPSQRVGSGHAGPSPSNRGADITSIGPRSDEPHSTNGQAQGPTTTDSVASPSNDGETDSGSRPYGATVIGGPVEITADAGSLLDALALEANLPASFRERHDTSLHRVVDLLMQGKRDDAVQLLASLPWVGADFVEQAVSDGWPESLVELLKKRPLEPLATILVDFALDRQGEARRLWIKAQSYLRNRDPLDIPIVDACLGFLEHIASGDRVQNFWGFMALRIRNSAIDLYRCHFRRPAVIRDTSRDYLPDNAHDPSDEIAAQDFRAQIERDIEAALEPEFWEVYRLREICGLAPEDVARRLGTPIKTVGTRLHRARLKLRCVLERYRDA